MELCWYLRGDNTAYPGGVLAAGGSLGIYWPSILNSGKMMLSVTGPLDYDSTDQVIRFFVLRS